MMSEMKSYTTEELGKECGVRIFYEFMKPGLPIEPCFKPVTGREHADYHLKGFEDIAKSNLEIIRSNLK